MAKQSAKDPVILLDAGNLLFKEEATAREDNRPIQLIKAETIAASYGEIHFDAIGVSSSDLQAGTAFFKNKKFATLPWLSANIADSQGKLLFQPHLILRLGGEKIGIIGLTDSAIAPPAGLRNVAWQNALDRELAGLKGQVTFFIVLSSLTSIDNEELARKYPQVRLVISAVPHRGNMPPRIFNKTLITQTGPQGKYLGQLKIIFRDHLSWSQREEDETIVLRKKIENLDQQILRLTKSSADNEDESRKRARLQIYRQNVASQLEQIQLSRKGMKPETGDTFSALFREIQPDTTILPVSRLVDEMQRKNDTLQASANSALYQKSKEAPLDDSISGTPSCTPCHEKQAAFWRTTKHAKAFATLTDKGRDRDPACLPCHTTVGKVTATSPYQDRLRLVQLPGERQNVGCENCHYPAELHLSSPQQVQPIRVPSAKKCQYCHTREQDPQFNYQKKLKQISCPPA